MKVMSAYSDKCHGKFIADKMFRKWGIGLEKAKADLDVVTQMNVRSAIFSLTKRYQADILSHKLMRLIVKLYTDNILLMILLCEVINVPRYTLTGTDLYMYSR